MTDKPIIPTPPSPHCAILSHHGQLTSFRTQHQEVRFRTSAALERYISVTQWDNGYIVVQARYTTLGEVEEYIDLIPILQHLHLQPQQFLKDIKLVKVQYD